MKTKRIKKILVANRGEIALRIHRAAADLEIPSVAIYSDTDRGAPHVLHATEAYPLSGKLSLDTYLNIAKIIAIAKKSGCDAIHPGYGFLAENPSFVDTVTSAGLVFIGPPASAMRSMGSKTSARNLMANAKVPIIPGTTVPIKDYAELLDVTRKIGYPVLLKASDGGGGKGMRRVDKESELDQAFRHAQSESQSAFGSDKIFVEKYLSSPRHIEIQIIADMHGSVISLGERECSIQRRHQKVIEESPSTVLTPILRKAMGEASVSAARRVGYVNAGTVEFLLDEDKSFYFLEMNTRLQVEHPVTEMVHGLDLVRLQIQIAEGEKLPFTQDMIETKGHAIECRICAENPAENFLPSTGKITEYAPSAGYGVRNDSGVMHGTEVLHFFDPLLAKLIACGNTREEALQRMKRALKEYKISGVDTTIPFCLFVLSHPKFVSGDYRIDFVDKYYQRNSEPKNKREEIVASFAAASMHRYLASQNHVAENTRLQSEKWKRKRFDE